MNPVLSGLNKLGQRNDLMLAFLLVAIRRPDHPAHAHAYSGLSYCIEHGHFLYSDDDVYLSEVAAGIFIVSGRPSGNYAVQAVSVHHHHKIDSASGRRG